MHKEILTEEQIKFLPLLQKVKKDFGLVGGTAIALQIGHRRSIDFDLFSYKEFKNSDVKKKVVRVVPISRTVVNKPGEYTFLSNGVRVTFYNYPYVLEYKEHFNAIITMPNLLTLGAMKAFALGQRAKWKDYVDLYFIMKKFHSFAKIAKQCKKNFGHEFNEKLFRIQLSYFADVSYEEEVVFMPGFAVKDATIQKELIRMSIV